MVFCRSAVLMGAAALLGLACAPTPGVSAVPWIQWANAAGYQTAGFLHYGDAGDVATQLLSKRSHDPYRRFGGFDVGQNGAGQNVATAMEADNFMNAGAGLDVYWSNATTVSLAGRTWLKIEHASAYPGPVQVAHEASDMSPESCTTLCDANAKKGCSHVVYTEATGECSARAMHDSWGSTVYVLAETS